MTKSRIADLFYRRIPMAISVIFHPLLMPTIGVLFLLYAIVPLSLMSAKGKQIILAIVFSTTFILPLALLPILYFRRMHEFIKRNERKERLIPLVFTSSLFYISYILLNRIGAPYLIQVYLFAATMSVVMALIISSFWKISAHSIGVGGLTALIVILLVFYRMDILFYFMVTVLAGGLIIFSRLSLNEHTPAQVYTGFFVGFSVSLGTFLLL